MFRRKRDRLGIMAAILETAKDDALKTEIMYKANLRSIDSHPQFVLSKLLFRKLHVKEAIHT